MPIGQFIIPICRLATNWNLIVYRTIKNPPVRRPGAKELLADALEVYDKYFWNEEEGLSCDTWNTEFTVLDEYRGINANMHTVEAFLAAADVTGDDKYRE